MANKENTDIKRKSLVFKLILTVGIVIAAFNIGQTAVTVANVKSSIVKENTEDYSNMAVAYTLAVGNRISGYFNELDYYVNSDVLKSGDTESTAEWLISHAGTRNADFDYILYSDTNGNAYTDVGTETNISDRSYFNAIMRNGYERFIDNPVSSTVTGKPVINVTRAIKSNGTTVGLIAGVIEVDKICAEINRIKIGDAGHAWIIAGDGNIIAHENPDYIMKMNFITGLDAEHSELSRTAAEIAAGKTGSAWVTGLTGQSELIVYDPIPQTSWGLALVIPESQIVSIVSEIRRNGIIFGLVTLVLTLVLTAIFMLKTIKPLKIVEGAITGIASGNADLTKRIEINSSNEIGFVVKGFNSFIQKLQEIIKEVKSSKDELSIAGEDMVASTQDTASAITQILANIESVHHQILNQSSSVEETSSAINQIASNISSLERMIENQTSGVTQASAAVEQMMGNITSVNHSVDLMANSFGELNANAQTGFSKQQDVNERIQQIEEQSAMLQEANAAISSIAEQTNLLAMNAAIEAAHAGEAGKGFSVVADEIRKLSETSTSQSRTIGEQLNNIKDSINEVVSASAESSAAFESVSKKLKDTDQLVIQIKSAMEEQAEGSKQINEALHTMNDSTIEVHSASQEMAQGSQAILEEMKRLQEVTGVMKESMDEMSIGARKINETGSALESISGKVKDSITKIGSQIDQFQV